MAAEQRPVFRPMTEADYRLIEAESLEKHEYVNGEIYAMASASPMHNRLAMSASLALGNQLRGKPCEPFGSDQRLKVAKTGINTYPNVVVACPPLQYDDDDMTLLDATIIVEVLSPSSEKYDSGAKFLHYAQLPSFKHYVLISQDRVLVGHRWRYGDEWKTEILARRDQMLSLSAIDCRLSLADVYERVDVPSALDMAPPANP